jgi:hypothetical protein
MPDVVEIVYQGGTCSLRDVEAEVDALFAEAARDPGVLPGVVPDQLAAARDGLRLRVDGAGIEAGVVPVVVVIGSLAPAANHVLISLWDEVILPRIKRRLGGDALGDEQSRTARDAGDESPQV